MELDIRTLYLIYSITCVANLWVISYLWVSNRTKFDGIGFWVSDFLLQLLSMVLILSRGYIPDLFSIGIANVFSATGILLSLIGLQKFFQEKIKVWQNLVPLVVYSLFVFWSIGSQVTVSQRGFAYSILSLIFFVQTVYLLKKKNLSTKGNGSRPVFWISLGFLGINVCRVIYYLIGGLNNSLDYLKSGNLEALFVVGYNLLFVLLTFSLVLLINKRLIIKVEKQEEKFFKVFHASPHAIILTRKEDGKLTEVNSGFEKLSGFSTEEIIGKTTLELELWGDPEHRSAYLKTMLKEGRVKNQECIFYRKGKIPFTAAISSDFIELDGEEMVLSTIEDMTDLNRLVEELKISTQELSRLNATKDKFFSIIAHDLRNPISQITALTELMHDDMARKDYSEAEQLAELIHTSSERAMGLLSNLLEWSRLQTGRIAFNPAPNLLNESVKSCLELHEELIKKKNIQLKTNIPENLQAHYDRNMVETVIRNLVSNAIKFVNPGGIIQINAWKEDNTVYVTIKDNGIGILANKQVNLFSIEGNYSTRGTLNEEGTGLGLVLCREFIERHEGKITLQSEPGKGSEFTFTLPVNS